MNTQLQLNENSSISRSNNLRQVPVTKILLLILLAIMNGITVYAQPAAPTSVTATPTAVCPASPFAALKATSPGNSIKWYVQPTGGTSIGTSSSGANFNVTVSAATTYYAESVTTSGITSTSRTSVSVSVNTVPEITSLPSDITQNNSTGMCGAAVTYSDATASGIPAPVISYSQSSGSNYDVGSNTVIVAASNVCATTSLSFDITVADIENPAAVAPPYVEVTAPAGAGSITGVDLGTPIATDNCGVASIANDAPSVFYGGTTTVTWTITDYHGNTAVATQAVTVTLNNTAPQITEFTSSTNSNILAAGSSTSLTVNFTDEALGGPYTVEFDWKDGTANTILTNVSASSASASHTYSLSGVYEPTVTVTDGVSASSVSSFQYLSVYVTGNDFTTAGGYFYPPAGSLISNPNASGKANMGNNCKPKSSGGFQGQLEFNFQEGNFNFKSGTPTNWDYLSIAQCYFAIFRGSGTVNGTGNYGVLVAQTDKDRNPSNANHIRIKIWNKNAGNAVVFDTQPGDPDNALPVTPMGNGTIKIHTSNSCIAKTEGQSDDMGTFEASIYPNPFASDFTIKFNSANTQNIGVSIYDVAGKMVQNFSEIDSNASVKVQSDLAPGIYFLHAIQGDQSKVMKIVKEK
ncbi:MAG TPA: T9SS type A sorting domain-containing protein [Bacteroidia bacterium]|nr:T9SS type A sorting domain-containing protein [Bacteroidia bacterium]